MLTKTLSSDSTDVPFVLTKPLIAATTLAPAAAAASVAVAATTLVAAEETAMEAVATV
jgi:hypothetical protein